MLATHLRTDTCAPLRDKIRWIVEKVIHVTELLYGKGRPPTQFTFELVCSVIRKQGLSDHEHNRDDYWLLRAAAFKQKRVAKDAIDLEPFVNPLPIPLPTPPPEPKQRQLTCETIFSHAGPSSVIAVAQPQPQPPPSQPPLTQPPPSQPPPAQPPPSQPPPSQPPPSQPAPPTPHPGPARPLPSQQSPFPQSHQSQPALTQPLPLPMPALQPQPPSPLPPSPPPQPPLLPLLSPETNDKNNNDESQSSSSVSRSPVKCSAVSHAYHARKTRRRAPSQTASKADDQLPDDPTTIIPKRVIYSLLKPSAVLTSCKYWLLVSDTPSSLVRVSDFLGTQKHFDNHPYVSLDDMLHLYQWSVSLVIVPVGYAIVVPPGWYHCLALPEREPLLQSLLNDITKQYGTKFVSAPTLASAYNLVPLEAAATIVRSYICEQPKYDRS